LERLYPEVPRKDFDTYALIKAWLMAMAEAVWNEPAELTEFRVGGTALPDVVDLPDGRKVALQYATVGGWIDGGGDQEVGRILLERAGGDLGAKIIDHVDG
jgi:hypothetical protein